MEFIIHLLFILSIFGICMGMVFNSDVTYQKPRFAIASLSIGAASSIMLSVFITLAIFTTKHPVITNSNPNTQLLFEISPGWMLGLSYTISITLGAKVKRFIEKDKSGI